MQKNVKTVYADTLSSSLSSLVTGLAEFQFDDNNLNAKKEKLVHLDLYASTRHIAVLFAIYLKLVARQLKTHLVSYF